MLSFSFLTDCFIPLNRRITLYLTYPLYMLFVCFAIYFHFELRNLKFHIVSYTTKKSTRFYFLIDFCINSVLLVRTETSLVQMAGIEPARFIQPQDFKSCASASSATSAFLELTIVIIIPIFNIVNIFLKFYFLFGTNLTLQELFSTFLTL